MPLQRRLPKRGFKSTTLKYNAEITLTDLDRMQVSDVDLLTLKQVGLVGEMSKFVKVIKTGVLTRAIFLKGISATDGARQSIESAGGSVT
jgi:large subunit ribosomal protein L15